MSRRIKKDRSTQDTATLLDSLRNLEEFAALGQFLFCFGGEALRLPDFGREDLERELLAEESELVQKIKMALLTIVSPQSGLLPTQFEEYTRRQYLVRKAKENPFGVDSNPIPFIDLPIFQRVKVLHQLSVWALANPERLRDKMKDCDELSWRVEPCGFDKAGNTYYILDDNRLYRRMACLDIPQAPTKKSKKRNQSHRLSVVTSGPEQIDVHQTTSQWSCCCVTLHDWVAFADRLNGSKHPDEKALCSYLQEDVIPIIQHEWMAKSKQQALEHAIANRKRSSRLDAKIARKKEEEEKQAEARQMAEQVVNAERKQLESDKQAQARELRMRIREQRFKERALKSSSRDTSTDGSGNARRSSRRATSATGICKSEKEEWIFDCLCGAYGKNYEDGTEIIACDTCDVWQHVNCQQLAPGFENGDFLCDLCKRLNQTVTNADTSLSSPAMAKLHIRHPSPTKARRENASELNVKSKYSKINAEAKINVLQSVERRETIEKQSSSGEMLSLNRNRSTGTFSEINCTALQPVMEPTPSPENSAFD